MIDIDWREIAQIGSQVLATGLTVALFVSLVIWGKKDAKERRKRESAARKRAWEREIEAAGRRMMERDRREYIRKTTKIVKPKNIRVYAFGPYAQYADAWKDEGERHETTASKAS